jgi:hypothetical protein
VKFGENGRLRLFVFDKVDIPLPEGGVNGGREVVGEEARLICGSLDEFEGPIEWIIGGWVADVGVGSDEGAALVGAFDELTVVRLFLLGWLFGYVLLDGKVGRARYRLEFAAPLFIYMLPLRSMVCVGKLEPSQCM